MKQLKSFFSVLITMVVLMIAIPSAAAENLKIVENEKVCMVTDMHFPKTQIPVEVDKKTYYGCCQNCKATLSNDAKARAAVDPVSGKSVDKAKAVIAARADHSVVYFENKANFEKYAKQSVAPMNKKSIDHSGHTGH